MGETLTSSQAVLIKAGNNISPTISAGNAVRGKIPVTEFINQCEGFVNVFSKYNWIDNYSTLNVDVRTILDMVVSDLAAIYVIQYDMENFASYLEPEDRINVLRDSALRGLAILKDKDYQNYMKGA